MRKSWPKIACFAADIWIRHIKVSKMVYLAFCEGLLWYCSPVFSTYEAALKKRTRVSQNNALRSLYLLRQNSRVTSLRVNEEILSVKQLWTQQLLSWDHRLKAECPVPKHPEELFVDESQHTYELRSKKSLPFPSQATSMMLKGFQRIIVDLEGRFVRLNYSELACLIESKSFHAFQVFIKKWLGGRSFLRFELKFLFWMYKTLLLPFFLLELPQQNYLYGSTSVKT